MSQPENWEADVAERIREQASSGQRQDEKVIAGPVVFTKPVTVHGDLTISCE